MPQDQKPIVVAGDVTVDWFQYPVPAQDRGENWRLHPAFHSCALPGGALLTAAFLTRALGDKVGAPNLPNRLENLSPRQVIHGNALLAEFPRSEGEKNKVLRVERALGYIGPEDGRPQPLPLTFDPAVSDLVVLDDAGNGFRFDEGAWAGALRAGGTPLVILKMSRPLAEGPLWNALTSSCHEQPNGFHLVVVADADDLRKMAGVYIGQSLSWERTAKDLFFQLRRSEELQPLQQCSYLVVRLGLDGAVLHRPGDGGRATLIFDPRLLEAGFAARVQGTVFGQTSAFTACLAAEVAAGGLSALESGVRRGLAAARALLRAGYLKSREGIDYPWDVVIASGPDQDSFACCTIEPPQDLRNPDPGFWRILDQKTRFTRHIVAREIVLRGNSAALREVPVGAFEKFETIDRAEIEAFSAIRELLLEFLRDPKPRRPLSFAVFGPPGAGKSFGVKQVMAALNRGRSKDDGLLAEKTFNISQFQGYRDLC